MGCQRISTLLSLCTARQLTCTRVGSALSTASARRSSCRQAGVGSTARSWVGGPWLAASSASDSCLQKSMLIAEPGGRCKGARAASRASPILLARHARAPATVGKAACSRLGQRGRIKRQLCAFEDRQGSSKATKANRPWPVSGARFPEQRGASGRAAVICGRAAIAAQEATRDAVRLERPMTSCMQMMWASEFQLL